MAESNYNECPKCHKKYHIKAGPNCPHCGTDPVKYQEKQVASEAERQKCKEAQAKKEAAKKPTITKNKKLKKCKDCGKLVSKKAANCPNCGAPLKRKSIGCLGGILIIFLICFIGGLVDNNTTTNTTPKSTTGATPKPIKPKTQTELREERIASGFSSWSGSHYQLTAKIKNLMNDPKSYEHIKTVYLDMGSYLIVQTSFRGRNGFGALVINSVKAKCDLDGKVLNIIEQGAP